MKATAILAELVKDFQTAIRQPRIARACICLRSAWPDQFARDFVGGLVVNCGDWRASIRDLELMGYPRDRIRKLAEWCERKSKRRVFLLPWKGGGK